VSYQDRSIGNGSLTVSKYDALLAVLPLPLLLGIGAGWLLPIAETMGVALGGVPSALLLGYGLFVSNPVRETDGSRPGDGF
jgi:hypothetical protein